MADRADKLKRLVTARGQCKSYLTRTANFLSNINEAEIDSENLKSRREVLLNNYSRYIQQNTDIACLDENDCEDVDSYEEKHFKCLAKLTTLMSNISSRTESEKTTNIVTKLPKINIPHFDGSKTSEYYTFLELFTSVIDKATDLTDIQKLYYLRSLLKGEALDIIINLPLLQSSYKEALALLKSRYDNKCKVIMEYINVLLELPVVSKCTASNLRTFVSDVRQQLSSLKNLNQPIDSWSMLIITILTKKLDHYTVREYHMEKNSNELPTISDFLNFLEKKAKALESTINKNQDANSSKKAVASPAIVAETQACLLCKSNHKLFKCPKFKLSALHEKINFIVKNKLCNLCLNSHEGSPCHFKFKCAICKGAHNTLIHENSVPQQAIEPKVSLKSQTLSGHASILLPTAQVKVIDNNGQSITVRALLDSGSQTSFITNELVSILGLKPNADPTTVIGISNRESVSKNSVFLNIYSCIFPYQTKVKCHIVPLITTDLPHSLINISNLKLPSNIRLADEYFYQPQKISMLLGADIFFQLLVSKPQPIEVQGEDGPGPHVIETLLGHVVAGNVNQFSSQKVVSLHCQSCNSLEESHSILDQTIQKFWQNEQVPQTFIESSSEEALAENIYRETSELNENKFTVNLPLKVNLNEINPLLGDSFTIALKRFLNLEKRLQKDNALHKQYKDFIDEYLRLGHAEYIDIEKYDLAVDPVYFLAHHPVLREESKTTPCRVVFDGSMKTDKKLSLNDFLLNGPVVQNELFNILILFRLHKHVLMTDITKMFRCCLVKEPFRALQNILWRENPDEPIKCIQLKTITYGLKSSSYLATRCLVELANRYGHKHELAKSVLLNNTYVDDILCTSDSIEQLKDIKNQLIDLLAIGGFSLHKWGSNCPEILENIPVKNQIFNEQDFDKDSLFTKTLGLTYDIKKDNLKLSCSEQYEQTKTYTKREVYSFISKFFDPLGIAGPIFVSAKIFMQKLWQSNTDWDSPLPNDLAREWETFAMSLTSMNPISIKRLVDVSQAKSIQIIGFCDGSNKAYGCCLYLRIIDHNNKITMNLLCSKSRIVSKGKDLTTPRIELNSALLLATLTNKVYDIIKQDCNPKVFLFTDSKIVLSWLSLEPAKLNTYVANRINQIHKLTQTVAWNYIPSEENPADVLSRGIEPNALHAHRLWWHGPQRLLTPSWDNEQFVIDNNLNIPELKTETKQFSFLINSPQSYDYFNIEKYSSLNKAIRVVSYILRAINNFKNPNNKTSGFLTTTELRDALSFIIKNEQIKHFEKEINLLKSGENIKNGALQSLHPFLDSNDVLRVGGRLQNSNLSFDKKHPIILPKNSILTSLIIQNEHMRLLHAGNKLVLASLNQRYWLINSIREVKKVLHKCIKCFRFKAKASQQLMGSLPSQRVTMSRPFQVVGIDFAGPFKVKQSRIRNPLITKGYVLIFVCFCTKAIHIELASDLTTDCFLACLKRFISRRNLPSDIFCDNAATFKGANNELQSLYLLQSSTDHQQAVVNNTNSLGIKFHFIPSYSPVFGGLWEAGVKSIKYHLRRIVGNLVLTYEELLTTLVQIEGIVNSRPLTPMSNDVDDMSYLTPAHFLTGDTLTSYPEPNLIDIPTNRLKFWQLCSKLKQQFWHSWSKQYLNLLQNRPKWRHDLPNVEKNSLVLIISETSPLSWPMARIVDTINGPDGKVRALDVKLANGSIIRTSLSKISLLPIDN